MSTTHLSLCVDQHLDLSHSPKKGNVPASNDVDLIETERKWKVVNEVPRLQDAGNSR